MDDHWKFSQEWSLFPLAKTFVLKSVGANGGRMVDLFTEPANTKPSENNMPTPYNAVSPEMPGSFNKYPISGTGSESTWKPWDIYLLCFGLSVVLSQRQVDFVRWSNAVRGVAGWWSNIARDRTGRRGGEAIVCQTRWIISLSSITSDNALSSITPGEGAINWLAGHDNACESAWLFRLFVSYWKAAISSNFVPNGLNANSMPKSWMARQNPSWRFWWIICIYLRGRYSISWILSIVVLCGVW